MAEPPPHPIHSFDRSGPGHIHTAPPLSNLANANPQLHEPHLPPCYSSSWRPETIQEFNSWNVSSQGVFPSTLVGPGRNPDPLPHPQPHPRPQHPLNTSTTPANNPGKRKRTTPPGEAGPLSGFGPLPSAREATTETQSSGPSPPPFTPYRRRNAASDVWAFARPLSSSEKPPADQWPASPESDHTSKPKTPWFGCKLCTKFGYRISLLVHKMPTLITFC